MSLKYCLFQVRPIFILCLSLSFKQDAATVDLYNASVVLLYLSEYGNSKLLSKMQKELRPGSRVVSFCWPFPDHRQPSDQARASGIPVFLYHISQRST